jgi:DNA-binding response OmpR family regulator
VPRPPSRNALVVEDDPAIRELLRLHLDLAGFTIAEAADGRRRLELARSSSFDLMLLDVMLPGLDGVTLCRAVRAGMPNARVPILMLTAREAAANRT